MTFSEKIGDEIKEFVSKTENIYYFPDSNYGVEYLNNNFSFLGTKIDLSKEKNYISYDFKKNNFLDMIKFFEFKKIKEEILASNEIHYIGDGITNSELIFSGKEFFKILEFLFENIPEHHYFFDEDRRWGLLVATEGWITYGEKSNKNDI
ncbi:type IV secretion protein Rhs [Fusobacterium animalis]|uniref:type IV secretion protein Rhs n=1 Tax=Fusobacterium animalis TaxID=76859 RepID=UPI0030CCAECE